MKTCLLCEATSAGTAVAFKRRRDICDWCSAALEQRGVRFCTLCHTPFPRAQVVRSYPTRCAACRTQRRQQRYADNKQTEIAAARQWHAAHPGATAARKRQRYATDADYRAACLARKRAWYARNKAYAIAYARSYMRQHPDAVHRWRVSSQARRCAYLRLYRQRCKLAALWGAR